MIALATVFNENSTLCCYGYTVSMPDRTYMPMCRTRQRAMRINDKIRKMRLYMSRDSHVRDWLWLSISKGLFFCFSFISLFFICSFVFDLFLCFSILQLFYVLCSFFVILCPCLCFVFCVFSSPAVEDFPESFSQYHLKLFL